MHSFLQAICIAAIAHFTSIAESHVLQSNFISKEESNITQRKQLVTERTALSTVLGKKVNKDTCQMRISNRSIKYFQQLLAFAEPNFVHLDITFVDNNNKRWYNYSFGDGVFRGNHWVWTHESSNGLFPYLNWTLDYGLLSFGLLDAKTYRTAPYVLFHISNPNCNLTFGSPETTREIAKGFLNLTSNLEENNGPKYSKSYYCYLAKAPGIQDSIQYTAGLYFLYPVNYINYNCCKTHYNFVQEIYTIDCEGKQMPKWFQCTLIPYILGCIIFAFFPIPYFEFCGWISKDEKIVPKSFEPSKTGYKRLRGSSSIEIEEPDLINQEESNEWLFLHGASPRTFTGLFKGLLCGLNRSHPHFTSRIKRFTVISIQPIIVYIHIYVYHKYMYPKDLDTLIELGAPMGFIGILGKDSHHRTRTFVPMLGGPMCMLIMYYVQAIIFVVLPKSCKQIVENGIPGVYKTVGKSPLWLSANTIRELSMVYTKTDAGYANAASLLRCSMYVIFTREFWNNVIEIQTERISVRHAKMSSSTKLSCVKKVLVPFYFVFCFLEWIACIVFYGVPIFGFTTIWLKGALRSLAHMGEHMLRNHTRLFAVLSNPIALVFETFIVVAMFLFYAYSVCLIFIESFTFISSVVMFCLVAVIVYPAVAFGYLFFFVVLLYYVVKLIHDFGYTYLELLSEAVEISRNLDGQPNHVTMFQRNLIISNVKVFQIEKISVNNKVIEIPKNMLQSLSIDKALLPKIKMENNIYGIPKKLFDFLIKKHRPVHQQFLKILLHLVLISLLLAVTMTITEGFISGPTSEISDVMHVMFIVTIGALPRVLEVALTNGSESIRKEIELRRLEESIIEFWQNEIDDFSINN